MVGISKCVLDYCVLYSERILSEVLPKLSERTLRHWLSQLRSLNCTHPSSKRFSIKGGQVGTFKVGSMPDIKSYQVPRLFLYTLLHTEHLILN